MKYYLTFTNWDENLKKVSFVSLLRDKAGMSFFNAKKALETLLLGETIIVEVENQDLAKMLKKESAKLGVKSKLRLPTGKKLQHA